MKDTLEPKGLDADALKAAHRVMFECVSNGHELAPIDIENAIRAYLGALSSPVQVKVRPLEWRDMAYQGVEEWLAHTSFDSYTVKYENQYTLPYTRRPYGAGPSNFATADEAKAACEEEYQKRIRSSLSPSGEAEQ